MSALPFISHHLFASAVRQDGSPEKAARKNDHFTHAGDVPLELLDWTKPLPEGLTKSLRGPSPARET
jgi:hypothetical protein